MSREKCEQHQVTDCLMCQMAARKKNPPAAPTKVEGVPDYTEVEPTAEDLASIVGTAVEPFDPTGTIPGETDPRISPLRKPQVDVFSFDVLPVDDSAASQMMRAAAEFSKASTEYAKATVAVANLKTQLLVEEARLSKAFKTWRDAEAEMKRLNGDVS